MDREEAARKLKSHGDILERSWADKVGEVMPGYALIWAEYVGNDGGSNALSMRGCSAEIIQTRDVCWQSLYTVFESMALSWQIERDLVTFEVIQDAENYARNLNAWIGFHANIGRIFNILERVCGMAGIGEAEFVAPLREYWKERCIVLKEPTAPLLWIENVLGVAALGEKPNQWRKKMLWPALAKPNFEFLALRLSSILREVEPKLGRIFAEFRKTLPVKLGWRRVEWPVMQIKRPRTIRRRRPTWEDLQAQYHHCSSPSPRKL